jgi:hypothetical protein
MDLPINPPILRAILRRELSLIKGSFDGSQYFQHACIYEQVTFVQFSQDLYLSIMDFVEGASGAREKDKKFCAGKSIIPFPADSTRDLRGGEIGR